jgi:hypothetical protein
MSGGFDAIASSSKFNFPARSEVSNALLFSIAQLAEAALRTRTDAKLRSGQGSGRVLRIMAS